MCGCSYTLHATAAACRFPQLSVLGSRCINLLLDFALHEQGGSGTVTHFPVSTIMPKCNSPHSPCNPAYKVQDSNLCRFHPTARLEPRRDCHCLATVEYSKMRRGTTTAYRSLNKTLGDLTPRSRCRVSSSLTTRFMMAGRCA